MRDRAGEGPGGTGGWPTGSRHVAAWSSLSSRSGTSRTISMPAWDGAVAGHHRRSRAHCQPPRARTGSPRHAAPEEVLHGRGGARRWPPWPDYCELGRGCPRSYRPPFWTWLGLGERGERGGHSGRVWDAGVAGVLGELRGAFNGGRGHGRSHGPPFFNPRALGGERSGAMLPTEFGRRGAPFIGLARGGGRGGIHGGRCPRRVWLQLAGRGFLAVRSDATAA